MSGYGSTLYDYLLFKVLDRYGEDAHVDGDTEGDHAYLVALATPVVEKDTEYQDGVAELKRIRDKVPDGMPEYDWVRLLNYRHLGLIMSALRRHGHLDHAPTPESSEGLNFL